VNQHTQNDSYVEQMSERGTTEVSNPALPTEPGDLRDTEIATADLEDLALKIMYSVRDFTVEWLAKQICLPLRLVMELIERMKVDKVVEVIGQSGTLSFRMRVTDHGRHRATEALKVSGYVGPAPVSIEAYTAMLERQLNYMPKVRPERVAEIVEELVLPPHVVEIAGLARASGRSLFLWGPPGNGKTSVGYLIHDAVEGSLWVPHCISVGGSIIKFYDPQCHQLAEGELSPEQEKQLDRRWVLIRRPFVVVGGELTVEALDLAYHPVLRYYEAPLHLKANGGTFLIDDFGCQRSEPQELLNRWVFPLERHIDYLTLKTGLQVPVPFKQMLILSTNRDPEKVMDAAFLRRMGYRLYLGYVSTEQYEKIFRRYAAKRNLEVPNGLLVNLFERYRGEERPLRGCEPRDLIERARDICAYRNHPPQLNEEIIDTAWRGYFGEKGPAN
jgi:MoxR-like ATPase